ncbi:hypothetical protein BDZ97DRAFT_1914739 [Flammula alnicola]|nr:hypothetical protein BDZ97DRAFT_1914739 [Flammula alnicola]
MSTDLGLDPSDPLNLLLHSASNGDSSSDESSQSESSQDWSKFSTLWADNSDQSKPYSDMMDFADLTSMAMDFDPSMSIESSALQFNSLNFGYDDQFNNLSSELLSAQFPFSFQSVLGGNDLSGSTSDSPQSFTKERRLSVTSSSSSSGASFSPVPESVPSPTPGYISDVQPKEEPTQSNEVVNPYINDPAAELAQRVRQSAGVMLAVPMNAQLQGMDVHIPTGNASQSKLPIPRLPHRNSISSPKPSSASTSSSAASTPPPSTPPPTTFKMTVSATSGFAAADAAPTPSATAPTSALPRPKTSHTTIERRYRTNLNARIQSLRMAVPALRVLEDREGNGKKIKKNVKGSVIIKSAGGSNVDSEDGSAVDVIDERGFVDGVKVARKCSKANVLGKAVEYIRVLKKREQRLKAEQAGLKTLIAGLVGGPALVREWEKEWRAKFGGEENDEVEGDDEEADDDDSDEEDGEDGDEERKRKRPKLSSASASKKSTEKEKKKPAAPVMLVSSDPGGAAMPEKRKRGRPRKILPPPVTVAPVAPTAPEASVQDEVMQPPITAFSATQQQWTQQQTQPQQFLLAVFALFSFFNSPLTSSSPLHHPHHHTGTVLTSVHPPLAYAPDIISQFVAPDASTPAAGWAWKDYIQLFHLLVSVLVLASFIGNWLGIGFGFGFGKVVARGRSMSIRRTAPTNDKTRHAGPSSWLKLGEECVLEGRTASLSLYERLQMYRSVSAKRTVSVTDFTTLAMLIWGTRGAVGGLARMKARFIWAAAKQQAEKVHPKRPTKISEKLVFDTLDIGDAAGYLSRATPNDRSDGDKAYMPFEVLGCLVVKERVKKHLGSLFVDAVVGGNETPQAKEEQDWRQTIDAARELGGHVEELAKMFERVWKSGNAAVVEDADVNLPAADSESGIDGEIKALLAALVLYRQLFADASDGWMSSSTLLSPPPTPTSKASLKRGHMLRSLRTVLGNRVFEDVELVEVVEEDAQHEMQSMGLEDARDRVVDMIFDAERPLRATSPSS